MKRKRSLEHGYIEELANEVSMLDHDVTGTFVELLAKELHEQGKRTDDRELSTKLISASIILNEAADDLLDAFQASKRLVS